MLLLKETSKIYIESVETYLYNIVSTSEMQESDNIITTFKNILNARILNEGPLYGAISYVDFGQFNNIEGQKEIMKKITSLLADEKVAYDINGYAKAPPSFRVWAGGTIESDDIKLLLPWIEWSYNKVRAEYNT